MSMCQDSKNLNLFVPNIPSSYPKLQTNMCYALLLLLQIICNVFSGVLLILSGC